MAGGAPLGNQNGAKAKVWTAAIERALAERSRLKRKEAMDELAEALLSKCEEGDMAALKELGDRLEGKPAQAIVNDADGAFRVESVTRVLFGRDGS